MCNLLNIAMESKVTSKTSSLKALILRAWRERWSDLQWGINIKTILPRGVSGDVHNLADCILQQALVGPGPNELILSYLKHSLCSQLVSYAAVLQRISKYDAFHKPHCIISLLYFLESIHNGITCRGKPEEDLLATACLSIVHWLLQCYYHALSKVLQGNQLAVADLMDKPAHLLKELLASDFIYAMLYSAKHDNKELYIDIVKKCQEIEKEQQKSNVKSLVSIEESSKKICNLDVDNIISKPLKLDAEPITYCLQPLLAVQNLINPSSDTTTYINQLRMIQRLKNYSNARLYSSVIRACMVCFYDVIGTFKESHWGGFTVLKLPQILKELHAGSLGENETFEYSQDVIDAFEQLMGYTPLLDKMDVIFAGNSVEFLLNELQKVNLVTEKQAKQVSSKRDGLVNSLQKFDSPNLSLPITKVIMRAEMSLAGLLKTLNAEYTKIQDSLLSLLCQVLTGNSFELMCSLATVEGKMKTFVSRLIKCNECSKMMNEVPGKSATTRALLFEISFLMLCSIVQNYGPEVVLEEGGDSFFEQWVRECMPLKDKPKSPHKILQNVDPAKVELLLAQISSTDPDLKSNNNKWHVLGMAAMGVAKELLYAWETDALSAADVKRYLNNLRASSCCLPICAAAWLCAYMGVTHQDALLKPMNMVQQFLTPVNSDEMQDNCKERISLMYQIIRKMQYEIHPPTQSKTKVLSVSHSIISKFPILEQLQQIWQGIYQHGWVNIQATQSLESLLKTGGPLWFVSNLVIELFKIQYQEDLDRSLDLIFAILHLDIENCTLMLISKILPQYLYNSLQGQKLVEPQSSALAKLCVYCIYSTLEYNNNNPQQSSSRKRTRKDDTDEIDLGMPAAKLLRLNESTDAHSIFGTNTTQVQGTANGKKSVILREPLNSVLVRLFSQFDYLSARNGEVSQHTHFILQFLQLTVQSGKERACIVLQKMPQTLVPSLLKALPEFFTPDLLLRLYDVQTIMGRKAIARDLCMLRNIQLKPTS